MQGQFIGDILRLSGLFKWKEISREEVCSGVLFEGNVAFVNLETIMRSWGVPLLSEQKASCRVHGLRS